MALFEKSHENPPYDKQPKKEEQRKAEHLLLTIDDHSLEGVGIRAGEEVLVLVESDPGRLEVPAEGALLCFANRHDELMVGRYVPPYIELPYRERTYRIKMGDRRVVGMLVGKLEN